MAKKKYKGKTGPSIIGGRLREIGFEGSYQDYLKSDHWQETRQRYIESDRPQKCRCGAPRYAIHHLTYVRLGCERLTDLEAICDDCHAEEHRKPKGRKYRHRKRHKRPKRKRLSAYERRPSTTERRREAAAKTLAELG
jgi:5-methylcytosine-specific restriction endonuclease McrA